MNDNSIEAQQFAAALQECYPRMWCGATMQTFPIEKYLAFADAAGDDGGPVAVSLPRAALGEKESSASGDAVDVFDGAAESQRMVILKARPSCVALAQHKPVFRTITKAI
jgi:hypothetical protein